MPTGSIGFLSAKPNDDSRATTVVGGDRSFNEAYDEGQPLPRREAKKLIGYVRQDDFLMPFLTVRETLNFAAALRLPKSVSAATRTAIVEQTITELGLADAADVVVGGPFRKGISGGEKRRLTIGCTLVQMPSVLVLDEPTTGLDSFTAFQILETLKKLARRGRTVIVTLHGPRSDAFPLVRRFPPRVGDAPESDISPSLVRPTSASFSRKCRLPRSSGGNSPALCQSRLRRASRLQSARFRDRRQQYR